MQDEEDQEDAKKFNGIEQHYTFCGQKRTTKNDVGEITVDDIVRTK